MRTARMGAAVATLANTDRAIMACSGRLPARVPAAGVLALVVRRAPAHRPAATPRAGTAAAAPRSTAPTAAPRLAPAAAAMPALRPASAAAALRPAPAVVAASHTSDAVDASRTSDAVDAVDAVAARPATVAASHTSDAVDASRTSDAVDAVDAVAARPAPAAIDATRTSDVVAARGVSAAGMPRGAFVALLMVATACGTSTSEPVVIDLGGQPEVEVARTFDVDGARAVSIIGGDGHLVEAFAAGGTLGGDAWRPPAPVTGDLELVVEGDGAVTLTVWTRGDVLPPVARDRSLAWFDAALLDDPAVISFARVLAAISSDGHGGALLDRWFRAFAAGPGAGRATFAQFLDELAATHGPDPTAWDLARLPFRVTGIHNRVDLAAGEHCGELRVSVASTHATFSPVHLIFLFRQPAGAGDVTPDGAVHCRGTARAWARLTALDAAAFHTAAQQIIGRGIVRERFLLAESVELSLSPWQWRQWTLDGPVPANPPLFQTIDVARVNAPGPLRDAFLAAVAANVDAIAARTWPVPATFRSAVAEVQPNERAPLVDLAGLSVPPGLPRALGMIGCPRCHTDDADFVHTGSDRRPSPFYDRELAARVARLDALGRGDRPPAPPFGPLQPE